MSSVIALNKPQAVAENRFMMWLHSEDEAHRFQPQTHFHLSHSHTHSLSESSGHSALARLQMHYEKWPLQVYVLTCVLINKLRN